MDYEKLCKKAGYRIAAQAEHAWRQVRGKLLGTLDEKTNVGLLGSISTRTRTRPKVGEASDNLTTVRETGEEAEEDGEEDEEEEDGLGLGGGKETADLPASRKRKHVSFGDDHEYGPAKRNHQRSSPGHQGKPTHPTTSTLDFQLKTTQLTATQPPATEATEIGARRREPLPWTQEVMDKYLPPTGVLPPTPFAPPKRAPSARPRLGAAMFRFGYDSEDEGPRRHYPRLSGYQATTEIPFYQGRLPSLEPGSPARGQVAMRTG